MSDFFRHAEQDDREDPLEAGKFGVFFMDFLSLLSVPHLIVGPPWNALLFPAILDTLFADARHFSGALLRRHFRSLVDPALLSGGVGERMFAVWADHSVSASQVPGASTSGSA